jgi:hypothetical protein
MVRRSWKIGVRPRFSTRGHGQRYSWYMVVRRVERRRVRLRGRGPLIRALALVLVGSGAVVASFLLAPTPDTVMVMSNGHRVTTPATMHAVDYAILVLRIGGAVAVLAGAYLGYRVWRPDRIEDGDGLARDGYDRRDHMPAEGGDPASRAATIRRI